jgi:hypothetical protein
MYFTAAIFEERQNWQTRKELKSITLVVIGTDCRG